MLTAYTPKESPSAPAPTHLTCGVGGGGDGGDGGGG